MASGDLFVPSGGLRGFIEWGNREALGTLPPVPFKVVQLATLDLLTFGWAVTMSFVKDSADGVPIFNAWLYFLASLHGINLGAFITAKVRGPGANAPMAPDTAEYPVMAPPPPPPPHAVTVTTTVPTGGGGA